MLADCLAGSLALGCGFILGCGGLGLRPCSDRCWRRSPSSDGNDAARSGLRLFGLWAHGFLPLVVWGASDIICMKKMQDDEAYMRHRVKRF